MGASEISRRAFAVTHGMVGKTNSDKIWECASIALPNSEEKSYQLFNNANVYFSDDLFDKIYEETRGGAIILLYDSGYVGETDTTLDEEDFSYISLYGQYFNPKWHYDERTGRYLMYGGNDLISELFIPNKK